jgi:hypothetical protein
MRIRPGQDTPTQGSLSMPNKFRVVDNANGVVTLVPVPGFLTHDDALELAAWLVHIVDPDRERFAEVLDAVQTNSP